MYLFPGGAMRFVQGIALIAGVWALAFFGCNAGKSASPISPGPVATKTASYAGSIDSVPLQQLNNLMTSHTFVLSLFSDSTYTLNDTVTILSSGQTVENPVDVGSYSKLASGIKLRLASCAGNNGQLSPANCADTAYLLSQSGDTLMLPTFLDGKNLVLTPQ
jgi:hypothetical protein